MPENSNQGRSLESVQRQISERLSTLNTGFVSFEKRDIEQSIPQRFEQQVAQHSERLAVKSRRYQLRYGELNSLANRIARAILASESTEQPIGILLENDAPMIAAILAVLKTGRICVPFDPGYPSARMSYMLEDSGASLLITNRRNLPLARELVGEHVQLINIDEINTNFDSQDGPAVSPDAIAYIFYTSGSTGRPKGICHTHRNIVQNIACYTNALHIGADDRLTMLHSSSFSSSTVDIFCALLNGGAVHPWDVKEFGLEGLADFLTSQRVTILNWIPTPCRHFLSVLNAEQRFPDLRIVALGSEPVQKTDVDRFRRYVSSACVLVNRLGTTETLNYCFYFVDSVTLVADGALPAGYTVPNKEVLLLDDSGRPVECGEVGEIAVRSPYLALGYWRNPELSFAVFLPDSNYPQCRTYMTGDLGRRRPDGCLEHLGRKDFQVKVRGHRIEVGEIEAVLRQHNDIQEVAVVGCTQLGGETSLVAYVVPCSESKVTVGEIRTSLNRKLPNHMVPSDFVFLDALPVTPTGKLDRRALPVARTVSVDSGEQYAPPRTPLEEVLAEIWAGVLKLQRVSIQDSFFDLGGHSLLAAQIVSRVQGALEVDLAVGSFFKDPTIAGLSTTLLKESLNPARIEKTAELLLKLSRLSDNDVETMLQRTVEQETTTDSKRSAQFVN